MVQFLSISFFSWISSIFVGFFKSSRFFVSPCTKPIYIQHSGSIYLNVSRELIKSANNKTFIFETCIGNQTIYIYISFCTIRKASISVYGGIQGYELGARGGAVVALSYKQEGRGFDSRWCHSGCTMALGSTQPLTEMITRNIFWG